MTTTLPVLTVLLIDNDPTSAQLVSDALSAPDGGRFEVAWVRQLSEGVKRLSEGGIAVVLLELGLADSQGVESFDRLYPAAAGIPILILGESGNEALALEAVAHGAQDYILPTHVDSYSLPRALRNAIERKTFEDALFCERDRALVTLNSIGDAVLCTDVSGHVTYLNVVAETLTGWKSEEAIGRPLSEVFRIVTGATRIPAQDPMQMAIDQDRTVGLTVDCVLIRRDGSEYAIEDSAAPIHDRAGRVIGAVIVFHDVSAARAMSTQMTYAAQHDLVTDLPNRLLLNDRISRAIALAQRYERSIALLFLDLDNFKYINDSFGHAAGDELLRSVSVRLRSALRESDTVSRQGGDEFIILLTEIAHPEDAGNGAEKIIESLRAPHFIGGKELQISGSIGISVYPRDGETAGVLIQCADTAMYHAKENGRNGFQFFEKEMNTKALERQSIEGSLRNGVRQEEFLLHYQPKVSLATGKILGVEALLRWQRPEHGLVAPGKFVSIAEECGLIVQIGNWVLREACRQARAWQDAGLPRLPIAVNVSAIEFRDKGFVEGVAKILAETGLEGRYLELELTEGVLMKDAKAAISVLHELKSMGVRLAVDDFGTGFSSLSYLRQFPIDVLKIDQSFVHQMTANAKDSALVRAIIDMGKSLKHSVVAEGIETQEQKICLQALNCEEGQGYLFSRPVAADQFAALLGAGNETFA